MSKETRDAKARWDRRMLRARTDELRANLGLPPYQWGERYARPSHKV
jgi:hypothetical protein